MHTLLLLVIALSWSSSYGAKTIEYDDYDDAEQSYTVPEQKIITQRDRLCKKFDKEKTLSWIEFSLYYSCKTLLSGNIDPQKRKLLEHIFSSLTYSEKIFLPLDKIFSKADECEYQALKERFTLFDQKALDIKPEAYVSVCLLKACIDVPTYSPEYFWLKSLYTTLTLLIPVPFKNAKTIDDLDDETMFQFDEDV